MKDLEPLSLMFGDEIFITKNLKLKNPTLEDIKNTTVSKYRTYVSILTCGRLEYADILWCEQKIWYEDIKSDWELFLKLGIMTDSPTEVFLIKKNTMLVSYKIQKDYSDALNFFLGTTGEYVFSMIDVNGIQQGILYNAEINNVGILSVKEDGLMITEMIYNLLSQNLRKINWLNREYQFLKGGTKYAKKYILKQDYQQRKVQKSKVTIDSIVSFLMCKMGNPMSIKDFTIYLIYDMYYRQNKINNYQDTLNKLNSGCIDTKKNPINWDKIDWASSI